MRPLFQIGEKVFSRAHGSLMKNQVFTIKAFDLVSWDGEMVYEYQLNDGSLVYEDLLIAVE